MGYMPLYVLSIEIAALQALTFHAAVFVYGILYMDWGTDDNIFGSVSFNGRVPTSSLSVTRFVNGLTFSRAPYGLEAHNLPIPSPLQRLRTRLDQPTSPD